MSLGKDDIKEAISTINLNNLNHPETLDRIIGKDGEELYLDSESDFEAWVDDAEEINDLPRKAVYVPNYHELDEDLSDALDQEARDDMKYPGVEGGKLAKMAIDVGKEVIGGGSFSGIVGFKVPKIEDKYNRRQLISPYGEDSIIDIPEFLEADDWYSKIDEGKHIAVITDNETVIARHIQDNYQETGSSIDSFDDRFWNVYEETLENYSSHELNRS
ncbi:MAG: hypothetical protein BRC28_03530 [Nanohaloarchaea archaeon SW_4_43_9]|nr:MAG: hypothetical protein BRC28_03530 [Nanohaloarchaea archaeon SW_4_43_9]